MKKDCIINVVKALLSTISLILVSDMPIVNITVPLAVFVLYYFYKNIKINKSAIIIVGSIIMSFFIAFGKTLVFSSEIGYGFEFWIKMVLLFAGFFVFFVSFISKISEMIKKKQNKTIKYSTKKIFTICLIVIIICWIPYIIAEYPSPFIPDTIAQFSEFIDKVSYNNSNPFIHTVFIKILYNIASLFLQNMNDILFCMSIIQCCLNAVVYSYTITFFYKRIKSLLFVIIATMFFALVYYNPIYNLTISKDTSFSIVCIILTISYIKYIENDTSFNKIVLVVMLTIFALSRINAYYALLFALIIETIIMITKKTTKKLLMILLISITLSMIVKGPGYTLLFNAINDTDVKKQEITQETIVNYSEEIDNKDVYKGNSFLGNIISKLPIVIQTQQIANVVYHGRELNEKEKWLIEEACPIEIIKESYNPILYDTVAKAIGINAKPTYAKIDRFEYFKLWLELFIKYPSDYVEAYLNMTRYYFYPMRAVKTASTDVWNNDYNIYKTPLIDTNFTDAIESIESIQIKTPFLANLFSPGTAVFALIIALVCIILNEGYKYILPYSLYIGIFLTLMISVPINDEFRYIYSIVNALPILCAIPILTVKDNYKG